jgi:hypothetical protein
MQYDDIGEFKGAIPGVIPADIGIALEDIYGAIGGMYG